MSCRRFLKQAALFAGGVGLAPTLLAEAERQPFMISLVEYSLRRRLLGGKLNHLDFPKAAQEEFGVGAIEVASEFFRAQLTDHAYHTEFKRRADAEGVRILLILVDGEGVLGNPNDAQRLKAVENHYRWLEVGRLFGCHSIRVSAQAGDVGSAADQAGRLADSLRRLAAYATKLGLNILVENHGHFSNHASWLVGVIKEVDMANCGTLLNLGSYAVGRREGPNYLQGVRLMMPYTRAIDAQSTGFDAQGNEQYIDYRHILEMAVAGGYHGYVGIDYEGSALDETAGIRQTKTLLERVRTELALPLAHVPASGR